MINPINVLMNRLSENGLRRRILTQLSQSNQLITSTIANAFFKVEVRDSNAVFNGEIRLSVAWNGLVNLTVQLGGWASSSVLAQYPSLTHSLNAIEAFDEYVIMLDSAVDGVFSPVNCRAANSLHKVAITNQLKQIHQEIRDEFERHYNSKGEKSWN